MDEEDNLDQIEPDDFDEEEPSDDDETIELGRTATDEVMDYISTDIEDAPYDGCRCVNFAGEAPYLNRKIAVTNCPDWNTSVYFQDREGYIRKVHRIDKHRMIWKIAPEHIGVLEAKKGTSLAAISRRNGLEVRLGSFT